ncbi:glycosyltransferase [Bacillus megaterium]|nr:glycosyltransferase [Priestia megaterium]
MKSKNYPLVTVITPSYNQAPFIRETIESVLTQDYSNLEYIVIDGGSNDGTLEILKGYNNIDSRFNFVSEPDKGQSEAINKGLKMAKGQIIGWLNSDDTYHPHAIRRAVKALVENPEWGMVYGNAYATDEENKILHSYPVESF